VGAAFYSQSWYRVADLRLRLRAHVEIHRHVYRGEPWYVVQDHATGQFLRFSVEAHQLIGRMDGERTLAAIWEQACAELGDDMPTQDEVIELVGKLYRANLLQGSLPPDVEDLVRRGRKVRRARWLQQLSSPLGVRIPLLDPDRLLEASAPLARPLFSPLGALLWLVLVGSAALLAARHWQALGENLSDRVLSLENLAALWLLYPVIKALHELGHGYAVKRWGGEVHEMGIMLLVFVPVPYVDASAASAFASRRARMVVGAAGILVEALIAALAMLVWVAVEPGAVRALAFNTMLIAGLSTVAFNGNPLLRFDGYYVLADWLEIPNLAGRANRYLGYLFRRLALGVGDATSPAGSAGEALWLAGYAVLSFAYRIAVMAAIVVFVAGKYFVVGVALAVWSVIGVLVVPLTRTLAATLRDPEVRRRPLRASLALGGLAALAVTLVGWLPAPLTTTVEGVVWASEGSRVRAAENGFVRRVVAAPGSQVQAGEPLLITEEPGLDAELKVLAAQIAAAEARAAERLRAPAERKVIDEELRYLRGRRSELEARRAALVIRSPAAGMVILPGADDLPGRFVTRGEFLGYVVDLARPALRVPVPEARIDLVRQRRLAVRVRFASHSERVYPAVVRQLAPAASRELPSAVLTVDGGGAIARDPAARDELRAFEPYFMLDLEVPGVPRRYVEERALVRFEHPPEPLAARWYRALRRLLLRRFDA